MAALALSQMGAKNAGFGKAPLVAGDEIPHALVQALNDPSPGVRMTVLFALQNLGERPGQLQRDIQRGLTHGEELYQASQGRLAELSGGSPFLCLPALTDPLLQAQYDQLIGLFITVTVVQSHGLQFDAHSTSPAVHDHETGPGSGSRNRPRHELFRHL